MAAWAELTPSGKLWTAHALLDTEGPAIRLPDGPSLRIARDGSVERVERNGEVAHSGDGRIQLEGYREESTCAGVLLLATFLSMMPSMAVVDGHPAMVPAPEGSLCNDFRQAEAQATPQTTLGAAAPG